MGRKVVFVLVFTLFASVVLSLGVMGISASDAPVGELLAHCASVDPWGLV
jgi:hypothetical protein